MAEVFVSLPPTLKTWIEYLATGFSLAFTTVGIKEVNLHMKFFLVISFSISQTECKHLNIFKYKKTLLNL